MSAPPRVAAGFTLIELVVALAILGIVAAVSLPAFRPVRGDDVAATVDQLVATLEGARSVALDRAVQVRVGVELATGRYAVRMGSSALTGGIAAEDGRLALPPAVHLSGGRAGRALATFGPLGQARCDAIVVQRDDVHARVACDRWTGAIVASR